MELTEGSNLEHILGKLEIESPKGLAVAVDGSVVPRSEWDELQLREGMKIEVLRAVQGG
jgi:sulfur carrier protein